MKVTRVLTAVIEANYDWTIVRVETDEGISGIGEAFCAPGLTATIRDMAALVEGEDARQIEVITRKLRLATQHAASGGGTAHHAISGIEAALWDLNARALGRPSLADVRWQVQGQGQDLRGLPCRRSTRELLVGARRTASFVGRPRRGRGRRAALGTRREGRRLHAGGLCVPRQGDGLARLHRIEVRPGSSAHEG